MAGAPANNFVLQNTFHHGWNVIANKDTGVRGDFSAWELCDNAGDWFTL